MISDTEIRIRGVEALTETLELVDAERFIALIQREPFDYTKWHRTLWKDQSVEEISLPRDRSGESETEQSDRSFS